MWEEDKAGGTASTGHSGRGRKGRSGLFSEADPPSMCSLEGEREGDGHPCRGAPGVEIAADRDNMGGESR